MAQRERICLQFKRPGFDLWVGKIPGEGNGCPLQYSCLENPKNKGVLQATVHRVAKSWTRLSDFTHSHTQTMAGNEDNGDSLKRSHTCTAALSAPNPAAGHHRPTPLPETPGHPQAIWGSLLWGHCSFLLGPGARGSVCALQESISQSCVSSGSSIVG